MSTIIDQDEVQSPFPAELGWRSWPAAENPLRAALVAAAIAATGLVIWWVAQRPVLAWIGSTALAASLWQFFVPVRYELNLTGVVRIVLGRRRLHPWKAFASHRACDGGIMLLPRGGTCLMDIPFGLYLPWSGPRDAVLAYVQSYLGDGV
jgi:hypothetical protein